ncbi:hypothetical protein BKA67DRAFT_664844 [Truncatella angustata]|uniref:Uncharacterized protein n=1 Tax=Truncatella angustata TaxID=152316 RepID=A0A9P8RFM9_9PEZI|nr:uncharacterized protein BKA67DRAFT_664844 [Truncatella angustata]KAH6644997.1 hypothetical protein BKA67DRAFT_664844 [Truncatella angustata]
MTTTMKDTAGDAWWHHQYEKAGTFAGWATFVAAVLGGAWAIFLFYKKAKEIEEAIPQVHRVLLAPRSSQSSWPPRSSRSSRSSWSPWSPRSLRSSGPLWSLVPVPLHSRPEYRVDPSSSLTDSFFSSFSPFSSSSSYYYSFNLRPPLSPPAPIPSDCNAYLGQGAAAEAEEDEE